MITNNKCKDAILLYIIIVVLILLINPQCCYYDIEKNKLKDWNLFLETKNYSDIITLPFIIILISILCYSITFFK